MSRQNISETVWTYSIPHKCYGLEFGARMTVVRLSSGKLWVHSPLPISEELVSDVQALGEVAYLVAPNHFHHLYIEEWKSRFPNARTFGSTGLQSKKKNFQFDHEIPDNFEEEIQSHPVDGAPMMQEWVFYLPSQKILLITDLVLNISPPVGLWTRFYLWASGITGKPGVSPLIKMLMKDKQKSQKSLEKILGLDFDQLLLAHGSPILKDGKKALRESYQWVLAQ